MHRWGHLGASLLTYAPIGGGLLAAGHERLAVAGGVVAAAAASLPDFDELVPGVAHRGPTHTLWFALGLGGLLGAVCAVAGSDADRADARRRAGVVGFAAFLSAVTHVAVDSLTPMGTRPFTPLWERSYGFDVVLSRNRRGNLLLLGIGFAATVLATVAGRALAVRDLERSSGDAPRNDGSSHLPGDTRDRTLRTKQR